MSQVLAVGGQVLAGAFIFTYGVLTLGAALIYTAFQKETWLGRSQEEREKFKIASQALWSLSSPSKLITHNFLILPNGAQLHYLGQRKAGKGKVDALVILLHGFPDSSYIWERQLKANPPTSKTKIVALDLPGCGGSDSMAHYGPDHILNAVCEAIAQLKLRYLDASNQRDVTEKQKCILVGHDWGGVISFRIAAETVDLVDNVVIVNSVYPVQVNASISSRLSRGGGALREWFTRFYEFSKLDEAGEEMGPAFSQLGKSSYIFLVTLRMPLAQIFPAVANAMVRYCHTLTHAHVPAITDSMYANSLALSNGPSEEECLTALPNGQRYGASVLTRAQKRPAGDWDQRVRLYKHDAAGGRWTPSYTSSTPEMFRPRLPSRAPSYAPTVPSTPITQSDDPLATTTIPPPPQPSEMPTLGRLHVRAFEKFKCPVDIIYGLKDIALDPRIALDGIDEYFCDNRPLTSSRRAKESAKRIVKLPECGHWSLTEDQGVQALEKTLKRIIEEE